MAALVHVTFPYYGFKIWSKVELSFSCQQMSFKTFWNSPDVNVSAVYCTIMSIKGNVWRYNSGAPPGGRREEVSPVWRVDKQSEMSSLIKCDRAAAHRRKLWESKGTPHQPFCLAPFSALRMSRTYWHVPILKLGWGPSSPCNSLEESLIK